MISGFLIAIADFAQQFMGESIQEIKLDQHVIAYKKNGPLFIALVSEPKRIAKRKINILMKKITKKFFEEYVTYLQEGLIEPGVFSEFKETLDNILKSFFEISVKQPFMVH